MNNKDYFELKALSKSQLRKWRPDNPLEFWNNCILNPEKKPDELHTDASDFGKLSHCLLFEPEKVKTEFEVRDDLGLSRKNKKWQAAQAEIEGTIITSGELAKTTKMIDAISHYELYRKLLEGIQPERPYQWHDEEWEVACKCKVDAIKNTKEGIYIIDYKTTSQLDSLLWSIDKGKFQYDIGFYNRMVKIKYDVSCKKFIFIFQSTKEDEEHLIKVMSVEGADLESCEYAVDITVRQIMERYKRWQNGDKTAWLPKPEIIKWDRFSNSFDKELADFDLAELEQEEK